MALAEPLHSPDAVDAALAESHQQPVAILKHSTACGLSARGMREFEALAGEKLAPLYVVVVQQARDASVYLEEVTGIRHETPQVLVLAGGRVMYHASHRLVHRDDLRRALEEAAVHRTL